MRGAGAEIIDHETVLFGEVECLAGVLPLRDRAGRIDEAAVFPDEAGSPVEDLALELCDPFDQGRALAPAGVGPTAEHPET